MQDMTLYCTPGSPYARVVRAAAFELGLAPRLAIEFVPLRDAGSAILAVNPTGKAPTLVTGQGAVLSEVRICVEHLEAQSALPRLSAGVGDLAGRSREGMAAGFMDGVANWGREYRRPEAMRWDWMENVERERCARCLAHFDGDAALLDGSASLAGITLASALGWGLRNVPGFGFDRSHPALGEWYSAMIQRDSMRGTEPDAI